MMKKIMCAILCTILCAIALPVRADDSILENVEFMYSTAVRVHEVSHVPMIVVLSSKSCAPCQIYKSTVVSRIARRILSGHRDHVLAVVDVDMEPELTKQLFGDEQPTLPCTIVYTYNEGRTFKRRFIGVASYDFVVRNVFAPIRNLIR